MAFPVVKIDTVSGGHDTTSSGAGPGTAISGSTGRTRNSAGMLRFGLFGATDDISGVATDGSAVLYMAISTAGQRNFSAIAATKNTRETGSDAIILTGTASLAVGSTTGWTAGDVIKVAGAGAASADLYTTIVSVDSSSAATLTDNAGTSVSGVAWENPKQFQLTTSQGVNTGTTNTAWAVGGKRATIISGTNSRKLLESNSAAGDLMPGWTVEMQSGLTDSHTAQITFRRAGTTTDGQITLRGVAGGTRPILTFTNNGIAFSHSTATDVKHKFYEVRNSHVTKSASVAISANSGTITVEDVRITNLGSNGGWWKGISSGNEGTIVRDCEVFGCASHGVEMFQNSQELTNCAIYSNGGVGVSMTTNSFGVQIKNNIIAFNTGDGINDAAAGTTVGRTHCRFIGNTIHGNGGDGIEFTASTSANQPFESAVIESNQFTFNGGYGINFSGASISDTFLSGCRLQVRNNNHYTNTSGLSNITMTLTAENTSNVDPSGGATTAAKDYAGTTGGTDFRIVSAAKALGYPLGGTLNVGTGSSTPSYVDQGAAQRLESGGTSGNVGYAWAG